MNDNSDKNRNYFVYKTITPIEIFVFQIKHYECSIGQLGYQGKSKTAVLFNLWCKENLQLYNDGIIFKAF